MAEAIMTQITMAGGAVNLTFNEVLYSYTCADNNSPSSLNYDIINSYDWCCAIIYNPRVINPFICFSTYSIFSNDRMFRVDGVTPSGSAVTMLDSRNSNSFYIYESTSLFLFA